MKRGAAGGPAGPALKAAKLAKMQGAQGRTELADGCVLEFHRRPFSGSSSPSAGELMSRLKSEIDWKQRQVYQPFTRKKVDEPRLQARPCNSLSPTAQSV